MSPMNGTWSAPLARLAAVRRQPDAAIWSAPARAMAASVPAYSAWSSVCSARSIAPAARRPRPPRDALSSLDVPLGPPQVHRRANLRQPPVDKAEYVSSLTVAASSLPAQSPDGLHSD